MPKGARGSIGGRESTLGGGLFLEESPWKCHRLRAPQGHKRQRGKDQTPATATPPAAVAPPPAATAPTPVAPSPAATALPPAPAAPSPPATANLRAAAARLPSPSASPNLGRSPLPPRQLPPNNRPHPPAGAAPLVAADCITGASRSRGWPRTGGSARRPRRLCQTGGLQRWRWWRRRRWRRRRRRRRRWQRRRPRPSTNTSQAQLYTFKPRTRKWVICIRCSPLVGRCAWWSSNDHLFMMKAAHSAMCRPSSHVQPNQLRAIADRRRGATLSSTYGTSKKIRHQPVADLVL